MACSEKQRLANQRNAQNSTGPRTLEGKAISRRNGLKHGLTGEGIVLPHEDAAEVERRFETLEAEMKPRNEMARQLVIRAALMTVKLDRSAVHEARHIAHRMRQARIEFDEARLAEAERLFNWIAMDTSTNARRLRKSLEGIDLLLGKVEGLLADLNDRYLWRWTLSHCDRYHHMTGRQMEDSPMSRERALTEVILGNVEHVHPTEVEGLSDFDRMAWARRQLKAILEAEIASLRALRDNIDLDAIELDRAEAAHRAIFDSSKDATLARKYEAASERSLYRALREFREIQKEAAELEAIASLAPEPSEEMGPCLPPPSEEAEDEADVDPADPGVATGLQDAATVAEFDGEPAPDDCPDRLPASLPGISYSRGAGPD